MSLGARSFYLAIKEQAALLTLFFHVEFHALYDVVL